MLESNIKKLTDQLERIGDLLEKHFASPGNTPCTKDPEPEEPEPEEEEEEEEEEQKPSRKGKKKAAKKAASKSKSKSKGKPEPEDEEDDLDDDDDDDDDDDLDDLDDDEEEVTHKDITDHIRKKREALLKSSGAKGHTGHKRITKKLLKEYKVERVTEVPEKQLAPFFEELKALEDEADL